MMETRSKPQVSCRPRSQQQVHGVVQNSWTCPAGPGEENTRPSAREIPDPIALTGCSSALNLVPKTFPLRGDQIAAARLAVLMTCLALLSRQR